MRKVIMSALALFIAINAILFGSMERAEKIEDMETTRITLIAAFANETYWGSMANGVTKAGEDLGISTKCIGFTEMDAERQVKAIKSAIYAKTDAIITSGTQKSEEFNEVLKEADEAGIPVILVDSDVEEAEKLCYIGTDNYEAGKLAGEDIAAATGGMGDVAVIVSNLEAENQRERLEGFRQALEGYPDIRIAEIIEGNSDARALNECISQLLEEEKELDAVFCAEGYSATTICQLIRNAKGEYDDLKVVGFGISHLKRQNIEEGILYSTIYQDSYEMGYRAVSAIKEALQGKQVLKVSYTETKSIKKENIEEMNVNEGVGAPWHIY